MASTRKRRESEDVSDDERERCNVQRGSVLIITQEIITNTYDRDFLWDQILKIVSTSILFIATLEALSFISQDSVQCLTPSQYVLTQSDFISSLCSRCTPSVDFFAFYLAVQAVLLVIPHYLWEAFFKNQRVYFKRMVESLCSNFRKSKDLSHDNFISIQKIVTDFSNRGMYLCYILKHFLQLFVGIAAFVCSYTYFSDYSSFFECPCSDEPSILKDLLVNFNGSTSCALPNVTILRSLWITNFILISIGILVSLWGLVWCFRNHSSDLNWEHSALFGLDSGIDPELFNPPFLKQRWWKKCFCSWFYYHIFGNMNFLFLSLLHEDIGQAAILKEILILYYMRLRFTKEHDRISVVKVCQREKNFGAVGQINRPSKIPCALICKAATEEEASRVSQQEKDRNEDKSATAIELADRNEDKSATATELADRNEDKSATAIELADRNEDKSATAIELADRNEDKSATAIELADRNEDKSATAIELADRNEDKSATAIELADRNEDKSATATERNKDNSAASQGRSSKLMEKKDHLGNTLLDFFTSFMRLETTEKLEEADREKEEWRKRIEDMPQEPVRRLLEEKPSDLTIRTVDISFGVHRYGYQLALAGRSSKVVSINFNPGFVDSKIPVKVESFDLDVHAVQLNCHFFAGIDAHVAELKEALKNIGNFPEKDIKDWILNNQRPAEQQDTEQHVYTYVVIGPIHKEFQNGARSVEQLMQIFSDAGYLSNTETSLLTVTPVKIDGQSVEREFEEFKPNENHWKVGERTFVYGKRLEPNPGTRYEKMKRINYFENTANRHSTGNKTIRVKCGHLFCKFLIKLYTHK